MSASLLKILADFNTQLATAASVGGTSATIVTATDDDGNALPTGTYGLTIDGGNSAKEYIICTLTSTALTDVLSITRQGVTSSGFARAHRRGAKVTVTDWAILSRMLNNLDGTTGFNSLVKLGYDADPGLSTADANKFATVKYVDDTASAGAPDASTTTKGVTKLSATPVSPTDPIAVGDNDTRVPTQGENDALAGTSGTPSSTNKYVTQNDTTNGANQTATTIAFVDSNPDTITDSGNGFVTAGFQAGQTITVSGSTSNNNTFTIASVVAGTITLVAGDSLTAESAGATVTIAAATIGKLIRTTSTGVIPSEILTESNVSTDTVTETASGDIAQYDYVYANGANTAKTVQPTAVLSQSSPSTSFTGSELTKAFKYNATKQVYFVGGDDNDNQELNVYIGTVNSAGTDVSFSAKTTLQALAFNFSVCELSLGHYIVIFQDSNAGAADGIKVLSVTYDGSSVTVGSATVLETTGSTSTFPACSTLDSSRALLVYRRDSDFFIAGQVISVSGNTISTNTVGVIKSTAGTWRISAVNLDTDKTFVSYDTNGTTTVRGAVVSTSGTSVTATGAEATISSSSDWSYAPAFRIATNKVFVMYRDQGSSTSKYQTNIITNSGTTLTVGAQTVAPNDNGTNGVGQYGSYVSLNDNLQLGLFVNGWTQAVPDAYKVHMLDMSGTTLSVVSSSSTFTCSSGVPCLVKLQPFIYGSYGNSCKQIINLTNPTETRLGVAMTAIANTVSGGISLPYRTVSGFVGLTPATLYYTDDDGSYTTESSIYTREYGVAINSTTMLIK